MDHSSPTHKPSSHLLSKPTRSTNQNGERAACASLRGKQFAVQLQSLLQQPLAHHNKSVSPHDLILKILTSFTEALSQLTFHGDGLIGSKDFGNEFRKKDKQVVKNQRGCYGRKR